MVHKIDELNVLLMSKYANFTYSELILLMLTVSCTFDTLFITIIN